MSSSFSLSKQKLIPLSVCSFSFFPGSLLRDPRFVPPPTVPRVGNATEGASVGTLPVRFVAPGVLETRETSSHENGPIFDFFNSTSRRRSLVPRLRFSSRPPCLCCGFEDPPTSNYIMCILVTTSLKDGFPGDDYRYFDTRFLLVKSGSDY